MNRPFPTTQWSLIARVAKYDDERRSQALEELCQLYWPPVYAFIRSKGASRAEAEDLTQGFFADLLARDDFAKVSSEMGKLRTFLLSSSRNYMANDWRSKQCLKRGGGAEVVSLDLTNENSEERIIEPEEKDTPESIFDRQWALTLLHHVVESLRQRYEAKGQGSLFEALRFVISSGSPGTTYKEIAAAEGMSESAVKVAAHRLKERYGQLLRETIADTLIDDAGVSEELRDLMSAF
ncbi:MAG: sigma-70 family RNA polymerase sigma factor [Verrucomicrobiales bacterium]|nr:sigma-70 family RNA polymerase sigma factor [Verrucomicrobiales bacterium]